MLYTFDKQFILDLNLENTSIAIDHDQSGENSSLSSTGGKQPSNAEKSATTSEGRSHIVECFICHKKINLISMRQHVDTDIINKKYI